jgi:hypothetical protein
MDKKKIAVVYDTSYLTGNGQSVKKFILARRFACPQKPGLLGSLMSKIGGKASGASSAEPMVYHEASGLFDVKEVIPKEVIKEVGKLLPSGEKESKAVANILADGALRVDLAMDTVAGEPPSTNTGDADLDRELEQMAARETDERICRYAGRLVKPGPKEGFELAVVVSEDQNLLNTIGNLAKEGLPIIGLKS